MMNKDERNEKMKRIAKRGAGIGLCAVLVGGLAAGSFDGGNLFSEWNKLSQVEAAVQRDDEATLLKTKTKSKDSENTDEEEASSGTSAKGGLDVSEIVQEAMPSVVSITTKSLQEVQDYFGFFQYGNGRSYAPQQQEVEGSGSGIIIGKNSESLLIATNYHVIEDANTVSVSFIDGNSYEATVNGYDEERDLAVVSVKLDDISDDTLDEISIATIGDSDNLQVGEQVVAIGNALGYGQSVTTGIVSAKNRRLDESSIDLDNNAEDADGVNLIQTDAAINPGNSGGALLNMDGEVVGINSAKLASTEVEGMGYAIAISDVADVLENLMNETPRDKVEDGKHGVLGITGTSVSDEGVQIYGMPAGIYITEVTEGSGADEAGLKKNTIITEFNGKRVKDIQTLVEMLEYYEPGEEVELTIEVIDGDSYKEKTVTVILGENPDADDEDASQEDAEKEDRSNENDGNEENEENDENGSGNLFRDWESGREEELPDVGEFFQEW